MITIAACSGSEDEMPLVPSSDDAGFNYRIDPDNPNQLYFTATPNVETWYTHWDFGDNTAAEGNEAEKLFFLAGEYEVRFKIFTAGGTAQSIQTISIAQDIVGPNLVQNGALDNDEFWTVLPITGGAEVVFQNGGATWTGGGWGHVGIYQAMEAEANVTYQINIDVSGSGMTDCWFEVYVGTTVPVEGTDYTDGGIRLGLNTWDGCGSESFNGALTALSCSNGGGDGTFGFPSATTAYLVIRSGGADLGAEGVTIDNITVREL
ncbi:MAG: PKD domain-containing protein [Bacteroidota bacterium]